MRAPMSLWLYPWKQNCPASLPQHFPLDCSKQCRGTRHSPFEPAGHRPVKCEMDSESSPHVPEPEFQVPHLGSLVGMTQRREAMSTCFERLESLVDLPSVKNPVHPPKRQLPLAFACHEPICRPSTGRPTARLPLPTTARSQPPPRFAAAAVAALLSAGECLY